MVYLQQLLLAMAVKTVASWQTKCYGGQSSWAAGGAELQPPAAIADMRFSEVDVNGRVACGINEESRLVCWGNHETKERMKYAILPEVRAFTHGHYATCLALATHSVMCYYNYEDEIIKLDEGLLLFENITVSSISVSDHLNDNLRNTQYLCILDTQGLPSCVYMRTSWGDARRWSVTPFEPAPPGIRGTWIVAARAMVCVFDGVPSPAQCWSDGQLDWVPEINGTVFYDLDRWGRSLVCGINATRHMVCFGRTSYDTQETVDSEIDNSYAPFARVVCGGEMACGLTMPGANGSELHCWGGNRAYIVPKVHGSISHLGAGGSGVCASGDLLDEPKLEDAGWHCVGLTGGQSTGLSYYRNRQMDMPPEVAAMHLQRVDRNGKVACGFAADDTAVCWGRDGLSRSVHVALPRARTMHIGHGYVCLALTSAHGGVMCYGTSGDMDFGTGQLFFNGTQVHSLSRQNAPFCVLDECGVPSCLKYSREVDMENEVFPPMQNAATWWRLTGIKVVTVREVVCVLTASPGSLHCSRMRSRALDSWWSLEGIEGVHEEVHDVDAFYTLICALATEGRNITCWGRQSWGDAVRDWPYGIDNSGAPYSQMAVSSGMVCGLSQADGRVVCSGLAVDRHNVPAMTRPAVSLSAGGRGICVELSPSLVSTTSTTSSLSPTCTTRTSTTTSSSSTTSTTTNTSTLSTSTFTSSTSTRSTSSTSSTSVSSSSTTTATESTSTLSTTSTTTSSLSTSTTTTTFSSSSSSTLSTSSTTSQTTTFSSSSSTTGTRSSSSSTTATSSSSSSTTGTSSTSTSSSSTTTTSTRTSSTTSVTGTASTTSATGTTGTSTSTAGGNGVAVSFRLRGVLCGELLGDETLRAATVRALEEGLLAGLGRFELARGHLQTSLSCAATAARRLQLSSGVEAVTSIACGAAGVDPSQLLSAADAARVRGAVEARARQVPGIDAVLSAGAVLTVGPGLRFQRIFVTATTTTVSRTATTASSTTATRTTRTRTSTTVYCNAEYCVEAERGFARGRQGLGLLVAAAWCLLG